MNFHHDILYIQERPISHLLLIPFILFIFSAVLDDSHYWIQLTEPYIMPVQILMCQVLVCYEKLSTVRGRLNIKYKTSGIGTDLGLKSRKHVDLITYL